MSTRAGENEVDEDELDSQVESRTYSKPTPKGALSSPTGGLDIINERICRSNSAGRSRCRCKNSPFLVLWENVNYRLPPLLLRSRSPQRYMTSEGTK